MDYAIFHVEQGGMNVALNQDIGVFVVQWYQ